MLSNASATDKTPAQATEGMEQAMRITHPADGDAPAPVVLVLPGGGYHTHATHEAEPVAAWLNGLGLHACVLRYTTDPHGSSAPLDDARAAMRAIRDGAAGPSADPSRVAVLGFSAGGHLAGRLASGPEARGSERPDLAVLCYPVVSFTHLPHLGSQQALLGEDAPLAARRLSPTNSRVPNSRSHRINNCPLYADICPRWADSCALRRARLSALVHRPHPGTLFLPPTSGPAQPHSRSLLLLSSQFPPLAAGHIVRDAPRAGRG